MPNWNVWRQNDTNDASKERSQRDFEERNRKNGKNRRIKRNVYLSFLTRVSLSHWHIAKLMIFTTLYSVNTTDFIYSHTQRHIKAKRRIGRSRMSFISWFLFVWLCTPETVANFNLFALLIWYSNSYSYYVCLPYSGCFNHMRVRVCVCLFIMHLSLPHFLSLPFRPRTWKIMTPPSPPPPITTTTTTKFIRKCSNVAFMSPFSLYFIADFKFNRIEFRFFFHKKRKHSFTRFTHLFIHSVP